MSAPRYITQEMIDVVVQDYSLHAMKPPRKRSNKTAYEHERAYTVMHALWSRKHGYRSEYYQWAMVGLRRGRNELRRIEALSLEDLEQALVYDTYK